jgi:hypothetical protein
VPLMKRNVRIARESRNLEKRSRNTGQKGDGKWAACAKWFH